MAGKFNISTSFAHVCPQPMDKSIQPTCQASPWYEGGAPSDNESVGHTIVVVTAPQPGQLLRDLLPKRCPLDGRR
jgi:hypothetical protein